MHEAVFRSVKRVCYAGLDSVRLRRELAERIAPAVRFDAHACSTHDPETGLLTHVVGNGVPAPLVHEYLTRWYPYAGAVLELEQARANRRVFSMTVASPAFAALLKGAGIAHETNVVIATGGALWGSWCLLNDGPTPAVGEAEHALLDRLVPHLARAFQAAALVDSATSPAAAPGETPPATVLLDERGEVTLRTPAAQGYFTDLADVGAAPELATPVPIAIMSAVTRVRVAQPAAHGDVPADAVLRTRGHSGRWYCIRAMLAEPDREGHSAVVVVIRPVGPREMAPILARLYGLSARERQVAAAVARGDSTKRIAARLGVSGYTVQEHLGRACEKVGVRGRKALIAKLFFEGYLPRLTAN